MKIKLKAIILRRIIFAGFLILSGCRHGYNPSWQENVTAKVKCPNLLKYTEDFQDKSWYKDEAEVSNNKASDLRNNLTADLIDISKDAKESRVYQHVDLASEGHYAFSVYLKALSGKNGQYAIGMQFNGEKPKWIKEIVSINDSSWTRATVKLRTSGGGKLTVFPGYALIKGATVYKAYAWGAQLELLQDSIPGPSKYCGNNVILGASKIKNQFIQN